jgi:hypothetical protein
MKGGNPIAVYRSPPQVWVLFNLVTFYDIHGRKEEILFW